MKKKGFKLLGIGLVYLGCMVIVSSVNLPKGNLVIPMSCLLGLGLLNIFLYEKVSFKFWWYKSIMVAVTVGVVISPFVALSVVKGG